MSFIGISTEALAKASPEEQAVVFKLAGIHIGGQPEDDFINPGSENDVMIRLSASDWRKVIGGLSPKTRAILEAIKKSGAIFTANQILAEMNLTPDEWGSMRGAWSGLTKRARKIANAPDGYLIDWDWDFEDYDRARGALDPATYEALKEALA